MSNELDPQLDALTAGIGYKDGANNGFWRVQPREKFGEDAGQWIEMGAELRMFYKNKRGETASVTGRAVGSDGTPEGVRVLIQDKPGVPDGIYGASTSNVRIADAIIPEEYLEKQGIDNKNPRLGNTAEARIAEENLPKLEDLPRADITPDDIRMANDKIDSPEGKEMSKYKDSPEAKKTEPELKRATAAWMLNPNNHGKQMFYVKNGKARPVWVDSFGETIYKGYAPADPDDHNAEGLVSIDEFAEAAKNGNINIYQGPIPYEDGQPLDGFEINRRAIEQRSNKAKAKAKPKSDIEELGEERAPFEPKPFDVHSRDKEIMEEARERSKFRLVTPEQMSKMSDEDLLDSARREYIDNVKPQGRADGKIGQGPLPREFTDELTRRGIPLFEIASPDKRALDDAFTEAYDEAKAPPTVDEVASKAKIKPTKPMNLNVGDVVVDRNGENEATIVGLNLDPSSGAKPSMDIQLPDGRIQRGIPIQLDRPVNVVSGKKGKVAKPAKPAKAAKPEPKAATPATPATPEAPEAPKTPEAPKAETPKKTKKTNKPVVKKVPNSEEVNLPDRKDDGGMIAPAEKSAEELRNKKINNLVDAVGRLVSIFTDKGKQRNVEDPNSIIDALLEENPNAKIKDDGTVVMERGEFTDTDGKKYTYEVGVQRTAGNQFMERYTLTDPETGEVMYDFYNADYKDSFYGLYGKTSGLTRTRDILLGREVPGRKGVDAEGVPVDKELANYFGPGRNIEQRLKYLRKGKDVNGWRLVTARENIAKFLTGRARELNKSDTDNKNYRNQFGNVRRSFVASVYEAIDLRDNELIKERLVQLLGRLPNNKESVDMLVNTLREEIDKRYKGTPREKELQTLALNLKATLMSAQFDLKNRSEVPFVSEDGVTPVVPGDKVRFINNEGDMVVGTVVKLNAKSGAKGGYKDTARVRFADGTTVDNLQTRNMLHTDEDETNYEPWVRLDEKLKRRADELGIDFEEYKRRKEEDSEYDPDAPEYAPSDAGTPYLGESGEEGASAPVAGAQAEDLSAGDAFYDADGGYVGTVIETVEVPAEDGGEPGVAVKFIDIDGNEQVDVLDRGEFRGPK